MRYKELYKKLKEENSRYKIALLNIVDYSESDAQGRPNHNFTQVQVMHNRIIQIAKDALKIK